MCWRKTHAGSLWRLSRVGSTILVGKRRESDRLWQELNWGNYLRVCLECPGNIKGMGRRELHYRGEWGGSGSRVGRDKREHERTGEWVVNLETNPVFLCYPNSLPSVDVCSNTASGINCKNPMRPLAHLPLRFFLTARYVLFDVLKTDFLCISETAIRI